MEIIKIIRLHIAESLQDVGKGLAIYETLPIADAQNLKDFKAGKTLKLKRADFWQDLLASLSYKASIGKINLGTINVELPVDDKPIIKEIPQKMEGKTIDNQSLEFLTIEQVRLLNEKKKRQRLLVDLGEDNSPDALAQAEGFIQEILALDEDIKSYQTKIDTFGLKEPEGNDLAELQKKLDNLNSNISKTKKMVEKLEVEHKNSPRHEKTAESLKKYKDKYALFFQEQLALKLKIEKLKLND